MYVQTWNKYLPIIRILLKRAATAEQALNLNVSDFEKTGVARKAGYKFNIHFSNGRVDNVIPLPIAKDLAIALLQDATIKELFTLNDYHISMNTKFQLAIKFSPKVSEEKEEIAANNLVAE